MDKKQIFLSHVIISLICVLLCMSSCEKHEGISYYKPKCEAELNGKYLIDQSRFDLGLNPNRTPKIVASDYNVEFESHLSTERGTTPAYFVYIQIYVNSPWEYLTKPQIIKFLNINDSDEEPQLWDYESYCSDNKISYATIMTPSLKKEIVKDGFFQITSFDREKCTYQGKFELHFSEGILKGEFSI